ncbi:MAG TPA: aminotransferase class V-fold PLP-dependent enzyme [Leucothrix mucor]|nr:aminotransferase class V-fold PLP-dependent enzyme [Leucothrix mucor]
MPLETDIKKDIATFNHIFDALLQDEIDHPMTQVEEPDVLFKQLDIGLRDEPMPDDAFNENLKALVLKTPKTSSNRFFNQLFGGRKGRAILGDLLAVVLNNSMYTYKVGGPQVCVEREIIRQVCSIIAYGGKSGGTFPTGGSMANFMALIMARDKFDAEISHKGVQQVLVAYSSEESHYSMAKNASFAGVGRDNVRYIPADGDGKMQLDALELQVKTDLADGLNPFFVNATAGTTVLGTYDPIDELSVICKKYNLWLHIDGALGGAAIFSQQYKYLLAGIEKSDSFAFNAHKMLGVPLSSSMIFARNKKYLYQSFSNDADYLYQGHSDDYNLGKMSLQCGRRNDALKFWTLWKSIGTKGLEEVVDYQFEQSKIAHDYIENHPDYTVYSKIPSVTVCFNYKGVDPVKLCTELYEQQEIMVGYGAQGDTTFIRLVTVNTSNKAEDTLAFFKVLEGFVEKQEVF